MFHSIQEYLQKINSKLTFYDCVIVCIATGLIALSILYIKHEKALGYSGFQYFEERQQVKEEEVRAFASKYGETYTFSWCRGSSAILVKNRVYFTTEEEAVSKGYRISSYCLK